MSPARVVHATSGALATMLLAVHSAGAQVSARGDVALSGRYVWHGVSRAAGLVMQPSLGVGARFFRRVTLEGGVVHHYELDPRGPGELSQVGQGRGWSLGEEDLWARIGLDLGEAQVGGGVVFYRFRGRSALGGMGSDMNTKELYGTLSLTDVYLSPTIEGWLDVDQVRGAFFRASTRTPVLGYPFPPFVFVYLDAEAGLNLGQDPDPSRPGQRANFAQRGITHLGIGGTVEIPAKQWRGLGLWSLAVGARSQLNFDDATRFSGAGRRRDFLFWLWAGTTIALGGDARRAQ